MFFALRGSDRLSNGWAHRSEAGSGDYLLAALLRRLPLRFFNPNLWRVGSFVTTCRLPKSCRKDWTMTQRRASQGGNVSRTRLVGRAACVAQNPHRPRYVRQNDADLSRRSHSCGAQDLAVTSRGDRRRDPFSCRWISLPCGCTAGDEVQEGPSSAAPIGQLVGR